MEYLQSSEDKGLNIKVEVIVDESNLDQNSVLKDRDDLADSMRDAAKIVFSVFHNQQPSQEDPPILQQEGFVASLLENRRVYIKPITKSTDESGVTRIQDGEEIEYDDKGRLSRYKKFKDLQASSGKGRREKVVKEAVYTYDDKDRIVRGEFIGYEFLTTSILVQRDEEFIRNDKGELEEWRVAFYDPQFSGKLLICVKFHVSLV